MVNYYKDNCIGAINLLKVLSEKSIERGCSKYTEERIRILVELLSQVLDNDYVLPTSSHIERLCEIITHYDISEIDLEIKEFRKLLREHGNNKSR